MLARTRLFLRPMSKPGGALPARYTHCCICACPCSACCEFGSLLWGEYYLDLNVLSVEVWEFRKKCAEFTPKTPRFVSRLAPERLLSLKEAPTIPVQRMKTTIRPYFVVASRRSILRCQKIIYCSHLYLQLSLWRHDNVTSTSFKLKLKMDL